MLAWLIGCGPGTFTAEEAAVVYEAVSSVNADAYANVYAVSAPDGEGATGKGLTWHTAIDGGDFGGTVEGPGSWTGAVELSGTYTVELVDEDEWTVLWSLEAAYVDVGYGDVRLDGSFAWDQRAEADGSAFLHTATIDGDMVARGGATGAGALAYVTTVSLKGGRYQVQTLGEVGGQDISTAYDATAFGL